MAETMLIRKEIVQHIMDDFGCLLEDMEAIVNPETSQKVEARLNSIKEGKVKGYTEKEFLDFMKEEEIDV